MVNNQTWHSFDNMSSVVLELTTTSLKQTSSRTKAKAVDSAKHRLKTTELKDQPYIRHFQDHDLFIALLLFLERERNGLSKQIAKPQNRLTAHCSTAALFFFSVQT